MLKDGNVPIARSGLFKSKYLGILLARRRTDCTSGDQEYSVSALLPSMPPPPTGDDGSQRGA
jgi:hypothetical protein